MESHPVSRSQLAAFLLGLLSACAGTSPHEGPRGAPEAAERMRWWREARFGLFIHWGLYAVPAGEWGGQTDYGEWIRESAHIPVGEYEKFQKQFNPVRFDPDRWVALAREAGMRYLVITSKHHDGFGLFDSAQTDWDVMGTPFHRDVLAELSAACARGGVRFCTYHSIMDWHHPDYLPRRTWEAADRPAAGADFERFVKYLHAQVTEVITKYHPGVLWFDGEWENTWTHEQGVALYQLCRSLDPELIVNNRVDVHRGGMAGMSESSEAVGDFGTPEQEIPANGLPGVDWETCMTMNDHWGYNSHDADWKSVETLVRNLIDVASKGGNYLLNVGPKADGTFPDEAIERLKGIGAWMKKYGEAIHGTNASPFESLPWGRCTMKRKGKDTTLYLHVFERPADGRLVLPGLGNEPGLVVWLNGDRPNVPDAGLDTLWVRREGTDVVVALPAKLPDPIASVVALDIRGEPIVYRAPAIVADAAIFVRPLAVTIESGSPELEVHYTLDGTDPGADSRRYDGSFQVAESSVVSARSFHRGKPVSAVTRCALAKVAPEPGKQMAFRAPGEPTLRVYSGDWDQLPDFAALTPAREDVVREVGLDADTRKEYLGLVFEGWFEAPSDDVYRLALSSDDGSDLWIDGRRVIDNDGLHGTLERQAVVALGAGWHALKVRWFNKTGGAELALRWAPSGAELAPLRGLHNP